MRSRGPGASSPREKKEPLCRPKGERLQPRALWRTGRSAPSRSPKRALAPPKSGGYSRPGEAGRPRPLWRAGP